LEEAVAALTKVSSPQIQEAWLQWVDALLAAGDARVVKVIGAQKDPAAFRQACQRLEAGLAALSKRQKHSQALRIAQRASVSLAGRMSPKRRKALATALQSIAARQRSADRNRVAALTTRLISANAAGAKAAAVALKAMGDRARGPLVEELANVVAAEKANPQAESAILSMLKQIAPKLDGYKPAAPKADRLKTIDAWRKAAAPAPPKPVPAGGSSKK
jgi:hypothetical protein